MEKAQLFLTVSAHMAEKAALSISAATLDRLVKRGLLRPSRALRRPLFPIAEIERFLRETTADINTELERASS